MDNALFPAHFEKMTTRLGDHSIVVSLASQELDDDQVSRVIKFRDKFVYVLLSPSSPSQEIIDQIGELPTIEAGKKQTLSQKLRNCLYLLYVHEEGKKPDKKEDAEAFNIYYVSRMEKLITSILNKLPAP